MDKPEMILGGIQFGPNKENELRAMIENELNKPEQKALSFFEVLHLIKTNNIDTKNLSIIDNNNTKWFWNIEAKSFLDPNDMSYLTQVYSDLDLLDLSFIIVKETKVEDKKELSQAQKAVIKYLENQYMDLDMSIDSCQGCMDGLEDAFEELAIYKTILASLGVDLNNKEVIHRITAEWFAKRRHEEEVEKSKMNNLFKHVESSIDLFISESSKDKTLFDVTQKINHILDYLKEKQ